MTARRTWTALLAVVALAACGAETEETSGELEPTSGTPSPRPGADSPLATMLADGQAIFGLFSGDHTPEQGAAMAQNRDIDFVFYSLESGEYDIPTMEAYIRGMREADTTVTPHPVVLRIPPIRDDREIVRSRVVSALQGGASGIVYPHVESAADAALAVEALGEEGWPANDGGTMVNMLIVEDRVGIQNAEAIAETPGISVLIPGPGDLRRAYEGDMEAVEDAIQSVLALCLEHEIACGITAGTEDIEERLRQGFRVIIATDAEAVPIGKRAAGR